MAEVFARVPKLGGFLVKADSEGRPGPFTYGRTQADGANMLADIVKPYGALIIWRCFVYNCTQDWRDYKTDRARAQYDNFYLDGEVILRLEYINEQYEAVVLQVTQESGIRQEHELSREKIADNKVTVTAVTSSGSETDVAVMPITIAFYKSSGAMKSDGTVYTGIRMQNAARKAELVLVEHTGRCFVDTAPDW